MRRFFQSTLNRTLLLLLLAHVLGVVWLGPDIRRALASKADHPSRRDRGPHRGARCAASGLGKGPAHGRNAGTRPPAAVGGRARPTPATATAPTRRPSHIVCPGPSRSLAAPPRKLDDDRTTCTADHNSGTTATGTPSCWERRMTNVSGMRRR